MILPPLGQRPIPEPKPLPGNFGCDAGPAADDPGKDRDASGEFEAMVAALAVASLAPASAPTIAATADADGDANALPAGTGKAAPPVLTTPAAAEFQIAAGGMADVANVSDLAPSSATPEASAGPAVIDAAVRPGADSRTVARDSGQAGNWTAVPADAPQQGGDGTDLLPAGPSDRRSAASPVRVIVHAGTGPSSESAADATGPAPDSPDTGDTAPAIQGKEEKRGGADTGADPPDAGSGNADPSGRQRPVLSENGAPLSAVPPSPARSEPDIRGIPAPSVDPADPSSRQEPAAAAIARAVHQMAEAGHRKGNGTVEIALSPEELGQLRLTIRSHEGGGAYVHLSADRQDTLDLMRRHVELLAQDMRELGYSDLSFTFQDKAQRAPPDFGRGERSGAPSEAPRAENGPGAAHAGLRAAFADSGLDIRI